MADVNVTRRDFIRGGAVAAVGAALGLTPTYTVRAGNPDKADTRPILNYNPQMEYRRCGKTGTDDFGRLHGRALEADRQGRRPLGDKARAGSAWGRAARNSRRTATTSSAAASIAASTTSTPA